MEIRDLGSGIGMWSKSLWVVTGEERLLCVAWSGVVRLRNHACALYTRLCMARCMASLLYCAAAQEQAVARGGSGEINRGDQGRFEELSVVGIPM